jgi:hypothetical protein
MSFAPRKVMLALVSAATFVGLFQSQVCAAIIASDDFSSYTAGSNTIGLNGGTGWAGAWNGGATGTSRTVENPVFTGQGNGAVSTVTSNANAQNFLFRQLSSAQTGTFYVGLLMRTSLTNPATNDFLQFYFNATTATSDNNAYGGGVARGGTSGVAGSYYVRRGSNASPATAAGQTVNSSLLHTYAADTVLIFKFAKSLGGVTDPYDLVSLYVNQSSEVTADAALSGTNGSSNANLAGIDTFHIRYGGSSGASTQVATLAFDNLNFADSYDDAYSFATTGIPEPGTMVLASIGIIVMSLNAVKRKR